MRVTWTKFEEARPIDLVASLCFIAIVSVGFGLIVQIIEDGHGVWVAVLVGLCLLHGQLNRAAER